MLILLLDKPFQYVFPFRICLQIASAQRVVRGDLIDFPQREKEEFAKKQQKAVENEKRFQEPLSQQDSLG